MNKFTMIALATGISLATAMGLSACNSNAGSAANAGKGANAGSGAGPNATAAGPQYAKVVSVTPIRKTYNQPQKVCRNVVVTHQKRVTDKHQIAGTAIGAVVGGLLGHQVGGGRGKTLATVAGAVAGGYAGRKIEQHHQKGETYTTNEQRCAMANHPVTRVVAYQVKYRLKNGSVHTARMAHDPGSRVEIKQTATVVSSAH